MQRMIKLFLTMIVAGLLASCATMFGDNNHMVTVNSRPQGARVYLNSVYQGVTPTSFMVKKLYNDHIVQIQKPGYPARTIPIDTEFQTVGLLNFIGTGSLGFLVDFVTDDIFTISPESRTISVDLSGHNY